jgi:hypothetical protein
MYSPIIRAKEFHHIEEREFSYTVEELFKLFNENRGNPYFLEFLVNKAEEENIELYCRCHHTLLQYSYFDIFKKLICWEDIPRDFPQDLSKLPPEIIQALIWVCVDSYYDLKEVKSNPEKREIRGLIAWFIKKKYIIDVIYNGLCPICKEFNTEDHLMAIAFHHLFTLEELSPDERVKERKKRDMDLYNLPCSDIVSELEKQIGGYICGNCHMILHSNDLLVNGIFNDQNKSALVQQYIETAEKRFNNNLIRNTKKIRDILSLDFRMKRSFIDYFFAFSDILKENKIININSIIDKLGVSSSTVNSFFLKRRSLLEKYGSIIIGKSYRPTEYHLNNYGITILRLLQYFKVYYYNKSL